MAKTIGGTVGICYIKQKERYFPFPEWGGVGIYIYTGTFKQQNNGTRLLEVNL